MTAILTIVLGTMLIAPARLPIQPRADANVEQKWHDDLQRDGVLVFEIAAGVIVIEAKEIQQGKLIGAVIRFSMTGGESRLILEAKEAELRYDEPHRQLILAVRECDYTGSGGVTGSFESRIMRFALPAKK